MSSSSAKCTVREVKKRSKKSRTLPGRLKLLTSGATGSCTSGVRDDGDRSISPPPPGRAAKSSKLSVFKTPEGQHWCFDVDAYGIYMDFNGEYMRSNSLSKDDLRPGSVSGGEFMGHDDSRHYHHNNNNNNGGRSKSLTRQNGSRGDKGEAKILSTSLSSSTRSMSRARSRSRLQTMNNSLSQCFGFGSSGHLKKVGTGGDSAQSDLDSEEYGSDVYVRSVGGNTGSRHHLDKTLSGSSAFGDLGDDEDRYYPSGCHSFMNRIHSIALSLHILPKTEQSSLCNYEIIMQKCRVHNLASIKKDNNYHAICYNDKNA